MILGIKVMKGTVMALRKLRAMVGRFVLIAGLAVAVAAGSVAVSNPSDAAAEGKYTCEQAAALGNLWLTVGDVFLAHDANGAAAGAYGRAIAYFDYC
jgi:hypothetical protein